MNLAPRIGSSRRTQLTAHMLLPPHVQASITCIHHCVTRGLLCSGAVDGSVCIWSLAHRDLRQAATRLLGRLGAPRPMGSILRIHALTPQGGGMPRVLAAGAGGCVYEFDLCGGLARQT